MLLAVKGMKRAREKQERGRKKSWQKRVDVTTQGHTSLSSLQICNLHTYTNGCTAIYYAYVCMYMYTNVQCCYCVVTVQSYCIMLQANCINWRLISINHWPCIQSILTERSRHQKLYILNTVHDRLELHIYVDSWGTLHFSPFLNPVCENYTSILTSVPSPLHAAIYNDIALSNMYTILHLYINFVWFLFFVWLALEFLHAVPTYVCMHVYVQCREHKGLYV